VHGSLIPTTRAPPPMNGSNLRAGSRWNRVRGRNGHGEAGDTVRSPGRSGVAVRPEIDDRRPAGAQNAGSGRARARLLDTDGTGARAIPATRVRISVRDLARIVRAGATATARPAKPRRRAEAGAT